MAKNPYPPPLTESGSQRGFDLRGRRVIVYGAESDTGRAIAEALREAGARVGVTSATTDGSALLALKKAAAGGAAEAVDLTNPASVQVATKKLRKALGGIDAAVAVPGRYAVSPIGKTSDAELRASIDGILSATYHVFRSASREIAGKSDAGRLLAVVSGLALRGVANTSAVAAAQAGVVGLVRSLAVELGADGVTTNAIAHGWMGSAAREASLSEDDQALLRSIPLGRLGRAGDVASLAVYLCSTSSGYINGRVMTVDGGALHHV